MKGTSHSAPEYSLSLEKPGLWTPFSLILKGFEDMSPKKRSGYISGTISTSLGNLVLGLGLDFTKKIY